MSVGADIHLLDLTNHGPAALLKGPTCFIKTRTIKVKHLIYVEPMKAIFEELKEIQIKSIQKIISN